VAAIACETGIAPNDLLDTDPDVFNAIVQYLNDRGEAIKKASERR